MYTPLQTFHLDRIKYLDGLLVKLPDYLHPLGLHSLRTTEIFQKDVFPYIRFIAYAYLLYIVINVINCIYMKPRKIGEGLHKHSFLSVR